MAFPLAQPLMPRASPTSSNSASGLLATLIPSFLVACALVIAFLVLRVKAKRIYQPRTYLSTLHPHQKTPIPSYSKFGWWSDFRSLTDEFVLSHHSLDGYLYLRFWRMIIKICLIGMLLTWPILMPVYATAGGRQQQFDKISYANASRQPTRAYATAIVACVFFSIVAYFIGKESILYTYLRPRFILSRRVASRISARTVLFTNVPVDQRSEDAMRATFGQVRQVWLAGNAKEMQDLKEDIDKIALKLENAEVKLCKVANKQRSKNATNQTSSDVEDPMRWADEKKRPTHRLKYVGKKVDSIDWCREHLADAIPQLENHQELQWRGAVETISAAFVEFETVEAAEAAFRNVGFQRRDNMVARAVGVRPAEVVWENLGMGEKQRKMRHLLAVLAVIGLLFIWAPLSAFIGAVSNVQYLTNKVHFLRFILKIPGPLLGIVTGLLPVIALAVLMSLVPPLMRKLSKFAGAATLSEVELHTQDWYFVFQIIIVFLITTFSSGASSVASQIVQNPKIAATLLAQNLPKASNFYINYLVLQGIGVSSKALSNAGALLQYKILGRFMDSTPRKVYDRYTKLSPVQWGSVYPPVTMLAAIAIIYSCISPLILGSAAIAFYLFYLANRYNMLYTFNASAINEQGAGFEKCLHQLFAGIYIAEICLIGLFSISTAGRRNAAGSLAIMVIFLIITIVYQIILARTTTALRKQLAHELFETQSQSQGIHHSHSQRPAPSHGLDPNDQPLSPFGDHHATPNDQPLSPFGDHAAVFDNDTATHGADQEQDQYKWETAGKQYPSDIEMRSPQEQEAARTANNNSTSQSSHGLLARLLAPKTLPALDACLDEPVRVYTASDRRVAYMHPAVSAPTPLLWLPADKMGLADREAMQTKKAVGMRVTTDGAWWSEDGKGRLETVLDVRQGQWKSGKGEGAGWDDDGVRECPLWEDVVEY